MAETARQRELREKKKRTAQEQAEYAASLKPAPEELKKRQERSTELISEREKRAKKLIEAGWTTKQATAEAQKMVGEQIIAPQYEAKEIERVTEKGMQLEEKQTGEISKIQKEFASPETQADTIMRAAQAGIIPLEIAGNFITDLFGLPKTGEGFKKAIQEPGVLGAVARLPAAATGKLFTIGSSGVNLAKISGLGNDISNIEGDIIDKVGSTKDTLTNARAGASIIDSIEQLRIKEEEIRAKGGDLQVAIPMSPRDVMEGKSANDMIFRALNTVIVRRQILERLALFGDYTELDRAIGSIQTEGI